MPDAVITTAGARILLARLLQSEYGTNINFRFALFTNDATPSSSSVLADFDRSGIAPADVEMLQEDWSDGTTVAGRERAYWQTSATEFTAIPQSVTAYGYVVWEPQFGTMLWAQRFDAPVVLVAGQVIRVWPFFDYGPCP